MDEKSSERVEIIKKKKKKREIIIIIIAYVKKDGN